jgi:nucleoside-diphosphate-sugar epimerase
VTGAGACLVTGAGGFIGYHLANALAGDGRPVTGVDLHFPDPAGELGAPRFTPVVADFRDAVALREALRGATCVFHLASAHLGVARPPSDYWDLNVHSLPAFLRLALESGVERFLHTSSVGVYGDVGSERATETTPPHPQSVYGETKLAGEQVVLDFGRASGLEVVVLRPAWVYGPGCPRTAKLRRALSRRRFLMIGAGANLRHPVYIDDMIQAFRLASTADDAVGEIFIVAGERPVSTRTLVAAFCSVFQYPEPVVRVPYTVGLWAAVCAEWLFAMTGREPPLSRRTLEFFATNNAFDITHATRRLGFVPRYSLTEGLAAMQRYGR